MATSDPTNDDDIRNFLDENFEGEPKFKDAWQDLILNDDDARKNLLFALKKLREKEGKYVPADHLILKSLTFNPPEEVKAIIVAHDPEIHENMATGLSCSFPRSERYPELEKYLTEIGEKAISFTPKELKDYMDSRHKPPGFAMVVTKIALLRAGVEEVGDLNFCYEDKWAKQGVLLLNSALTVNKGDSNMGNKHDFWLDFTARLIFLVLRESRHKPVLGMFWCDFAEKVLDKIKGYNVNLDNCRHYHHPTWPRNGPNNFIKEAKKDFRKLKEILQEGEEQPALQDDLRKLKL